MKNSRTCASCGAFAALANECRAKSPQMALVAGPQGPITLGIFPPTKPENWCAEWRPEQTTIAMNQ